MASGCGLMCVRCDVFAATFIYRYMARTLSTRWAQQEFAFRRGCFLWVLRFLGVAEVRGSLPQNNQPWDVALCSVALVAHFPMELGPAIPPRWMTATGDAWTLEQRRGRGL
jgi:hypothetical protein